MTQLANNLNNNDQNKKNKKLGTFLIYILVPVLILVGIYYYSSSSTQDKKEYYEIVQLFEENKVSSYNLNLSNGSLKYTLFEDNDSEKVYSYTVPNVSIFVDDIHDNVIEYNKANKDNPIKMDYNPGSSNSWLISLLPTVLMIVVLVALMMFMVKRMNQSVNGEMNRTLGFGKARVNVAKDEDRKKTTFKNVAGADEEKEELVEIVEFLKNPKKFNDLGARIPKGILLVGPPGTGKTLLARAVAGEADVPFFSISGSDFVEMYVGVGASRVRDLFSQAKKNSPSIIFIDEIDAVGRHRGAGMGGGHDEREQPLNQMLVEMDGFGVNEGVIIIAATNRPDILDPAL